MQFEEMVVVIVAMTFGYNLLKILFTGGNTEEKELKRKRKEARKAARAAHRHPESYCDPNPQDNEELYDRAQNLMRRLSTLEEIIAADSTVKRG